MATQLAWALHGAFAQTRPLAPVSYALVSLHAPLPAIYERGLNGHHLSRDSGCGAEQRGGGGRTGGAWRRGASVPLRSCSHTRQIPQAVARSPFYRKHRDSQTGTTGRAVERSQKANRLPSGP